MSMVKTREGYKMGQWNLWRLDDQWNGEKRWSLGVNGPRMYLTCDEETATYVLFALANTDLDVALANMPKSIATDSK